jgi:hypothetical protein
MIAVGHRVRQIGLLFALVPISPDASAREGLRLSPPPTALSAMGCFIVGSRHWGRFVPIGLGVLCLVSVMAWWSVASPLLDGLVIASVMWYWACALGVTFASGKSSDKCG